MARPRSKVEDLVAVASHELRQPLASIRGFTEMLLHHWADFSDEEKIQMLEEVLYDAKRVGDLLDGLLDSSRPGGAPRGLALAPTDLRQVLARAVRQLAPLYPGLGTTIEVADDVPEVMADAAKLGQVMSNILDNSCKYGSVQGLRATMAFVPEAGPPEGAGRVRVTISDSGPGIGPEDLAHITDKFFRPERTVPAGRGLGLWVCKEIVEDHGGQLEVRSGPGQGTSVSFEIPLRPVPKTGKLAGS